MERVREPLAVAVATAFKQLLSEKHLYQHVGVDMSCISVLAKAIHQRFGEAASEPGMGGSYVHRPARDNLIEEGTVIADNLWLPGYITVVPQKFLVGTNPITFDLPTINTFCDYCGERWPFNPVPEGSEVVQGVGQDEFYYLGYQCQQ